MNPKDIYFLMNKKGGWIDGFDHYYKSVNMIKGDGTRALKKATSMLDDLQDFCNTKFPNCCHWIHCSDDKSKILSESLFHNDEKNGWFKYDVDYVDDAEDGLKKKGWQDIKSQINKHFEGIHDTDKAVLVPR